MIKFPIHYLSLNQEHPTRHRYLSAWTVSAASTSVGVKKARKYLRTPTRLRNDATKIWSRDNILTSSRTYSSSRRFSEMNDEVLRNRLPERTKTEIDSQLSFAMNFPTLAGNLIAIQKLLNWIHRETFLGAYLTCAPRVRLFGKMIDLWLFNPLLPEVSISCACCSCSISTT